MPDIREQKLLYHLTSMKNLESILLSGLKPRSLINNFKDVADPAIIASRKGYELDKYVPFHWFAKNPFDGRVQADRKDEHFVLITVRRATAQEQNWQVIPRHPLSGNIEVLDYVAGFSAIDWTRMNARDYRDQECKCACMAECLAPSLLMPDKFFKIFVKTDDDHDVALRLMQKHKIFVDVQANSRMFL